jgi:hypothetical protein
VTNIYVDLSLTDMVRFSSSRVSAAANLILERRMTIGRCSPALPEDRQRHGGEVPEGVAVEDPVQGREVQQLQRHGACDQQHTRRAELYVGPVPPGSMFV